MLGALCQQIFGHVLFFKMFSTSLGFKRSILDSGDSFYSFFRITLLYRRSSGQIFDLPFQLSYPVCFALQFGTEDFLLTI